MKNNKRAERRHRSKCKLKRRINIWINSIDVFIDADGGKHKVGSGGCKIVKAKIMATIYEMGVGKK